MSVTQTPFVATFARLISLSQDASPENFYSTEDYHKLQTLGPSLPKLDFPLPQVYSPKQLESSIAVSFKSIKPPHKFTAQLALVSLSTSVLKLKSELIQNTPLLVEAGAVPTDLKFMIRAKVLSDNVAISQYSTGDDLAVTVMVAPTVGTKKSVSEDLGAADPAEALSVISETTWQRISKLVEQDLGAAEAKEVVEKFRGVV